jgi:adenylylsulfate kinase
MASIVFLTGVPASGKTTIAKELYKLTQEAHELCNFPECVVLDGDMLRTFWTDLSMSPEDRETNVLRVANIAAVLCRQLYDALIVIAMIAPNEEVREKAYDILADTGNPEGMIEVHLHAPLEVRLDRDPKGLYEKALKGEIKDLTGFDAPYDIPSDPCLSLNTAECTPYEAATKILQVLG